MFAKIEAEIPFNLMRQCDRLKDMPYEEFKELPSFPHHPRSCFCSGTGLKITTLGYEVIRLIKHVFNEDPGRLINASFKHATTMEDVIRYSSEQIRREEKYAAREWDHRNETAACPNCSTKCVYRGGIDEWECRKCIKYFKSNLLKIEVKTEK